jgi:hypothetical protein
MKLLLKLAAIAVMVGGLVAPMGAAIADSQPRDNDANAIMYGGCYSKQECNSKIAKGDTKHSAGNLQQIYFKENRGMTSENFQHTVDGVVYKNGDVRVNGVLVATGARAIGRTNMAGSVKSGSVYERPTSVSFAASSIPAWVNMDGGTFHYFVIKSCGNWGHATPVKKPTPTPTKTPTPTPTPTQSFKCVALTPSKLGTSADKVKFRFTVTPEAKNVTITGYRFTLSDSNQTIDTDAKTPHLDHEFPAGTYTVKAQVKTSAGITAISTACSATVTVSKATSSSTPTVTPTSTPEVLGATLPATGPEAALGGMAGLTAIGFASRAYLRSRKGLIDALRGKNRRQ